MKKILEQYASYNLWANQKLTGIILQLPQETVEASVISSFSSLQLTLLHMWNAESIWWQRLKLVEIIQIPGNRDHAVAEIVSGLLAQSTLWQSWVEKNSEAVFKHEFIYRNSKKEQFKQPVYEMLLHAFNHATYHRGQLVTMLRQLGVTGIPSTDFILFTRGK